VKATFVNILWLGLLSAVSAGAGEAVSGWGAVVGAPQLDPWIANAVSNSPAFNVRRGNVRTAQARTAQARSVAQPSMSLEGDWRGGRKKGRDEGTGTMALEPFTGRASLEWELDLFGRVRAVVGAARYAEEMAGLELEARELTLAAELAQQYVQGRYLAEQLRLLRQAETANRAIADYRANRAAAGLVRPEEVDRARAATRKAEARVESAREQWELLAARWRYLTPADGVPPLDEHTGTLATAPASPPVGSLHAYAVLRPDVRAAYAAWQEAGRAATAAARDRGPIVQAIASAEGESPSPVEDPADWTAWAGVRLSLPVLAPERVAKMRIARAQTRVGESLYEDAVSRAVLDLRESYARRVRTEGRWRAARASADLLKTGFASETRRFDRGLASRPDVEEARLSWLAGEEEALALQARTLQEHLSLLRACGRP